MTVGTVLVGIVHQIPTLGDTWVGGGIQVVGLLHDLPESLGPCCLAGEALQVLFRDNPFLQEVVGAHLGVIPIVQAVLLVGQGDVPQLEAMDSRSLHSLDN